MNYLDFFSSVIELHQMILSPLCKEYGLSVMEMVILFFLDNNPEYDTAAEIVRRRHLPKSSVSTSIRSLEEKGLVTKEMRNGNRRSEHLVLGEKSKEILKKGYDEMKRFSDIISDGLSEEQKQDINRHFEIMQKNITNALKQDKA